MFYVFGINGPMYHGGPERLSQIAPVRGAQRPAALRGDPSDIESRESNARWARPEEDKPQEDRHVSIRGLDALAAYLGKPKEERQPLTLVCDVMTRGAVTVNAHITVAAAWDILAQHRVSQAPVLDERNRVIGLLLRGDMAPLALLPKPGALGEAMALARRPVRDAMISPIPAVDEDTQLRRVAHALLTMGLPGLPVTDSKGYLSGFISRTDILRAVAADPPLDLWG